MSDDDGVTWFQSRQPPVPLDHSQLFTGKPPRSLRSKMGGYPNVLYACQGNFPQMCLARGRARRVKYAPQRMDLCGRLADGSGDVTEGPLKCLIALPGSTRSIRTPSAIVSSMVGRFTTPRSASTGR